MYLEIGNDLLIESRAVLGVFDLDNTSWSKRTRAFLEAAQENGELIDAAEEELKRTGITIREGSADDAFLLTNLAVWRYQNRDSAGAMPPWLAQYRRERWLAERAVHEDAP